MNDIADRTAQPYTFGVIFYSKKPWSNMLKFVSALLCLYISVDIYSLGQKNKNHSMLDHPGYINT